MSGESNTFLAQAQSLNPTTRSPTNVELGCTTTLPTDVFSIRNIRVKFNMRMTLRERARGRTESRWLVSPKTIGATRAKNLGGGLEPKYFYIHLFINDLNEHFTNFLEGAIIGNFAYAERTLESAYKNHGFYARIESHVTRGLDKLYTVYTYLSPRVGW